MKAALEEDCPEAAECAQALRDETALFKKNLPIIEALANPGTGETVGNTSQFVAKAEWLGKAETFDAVIPEITVLGKTYNNLEFNYPKGN